MGLFATAWAINTKGDPLSAVNLVIKTLWDSAQFDYMLVPINGNNSFTPRPQLIDKPDQLDQVNPFKPIMVENAAQLIPDIVRKYPEKKIGALLRPCEIRALIEMTKHGFLKLDHIITISVDCLGTFPPEEYISRAKNKGSTQEGAGETIRFSKTEGILTYRYRSVCQICVSPEAKGADINIYTLGLPLRQTIIIESNHPILSETIKTQELEATQADEVLLKQHERIVAKTINQHRSTMDRLVQNLGELLPKNINDIISQYQNCGSCQNCMDVCPICSIDYPKRETNGCYQREDIMRWLISCSGCGICEQVCEKQLPLGIIFSHVREQLMQEYNYIPGISREDPLPIFL